jgi:hypothetical protein
MGTYFVELPGTLTLAKLGKAIEGEEALGTQFLASRLWVNSGNALTNLAEFQELDTEPDPPLGTPTVKKQLAAGDEPIWAGPMVVQGTAEHTVYVLRS